MLFLLASCNKKDNDSIKFLVNKKFGNSNFSYKIYSQTNNYKVWLATQQVDSIFFIQDLVNNTVYYFLEPTFDKLTKDTFLGKLPSSFYVNIKKDISTEIYKIIPAQFSEAAALFDTLLCAKDEHHNLFEKVDNLTPIINDYYPLLKTQQSQSAFIQEISFLQERLKYYNTLIYKVKNKPFLLVILWKENKGNLSVYGRINPIPSISIYHILL